MSFRYGPRTAAPLPEGSRPTGGAWDRSAWPLYFVATGPEQLFHASRLHQNLLVAMNEIEGPKQKDFLAALHRDARRARLHRLGRVQSGEQPCEETRHLDGSGALDGAARLHRGRVQQTHAQCKGRDGSFHVLPRSAGCSRFPFRFR